MLNQIEFTDTHLVIRGASRDLLRKIDQATSYKVAGHKFAPAFKNGYWDGKEHLLKHSSKHGYRVPIGLAEDVVKILHGFTYDVLDSRTIHEERRNLIWNDDIKPRYYQFEAVNSLFKKTIRQPLFGCGLLKMPIRSGKTKTAALCIKTLGLRALMVVPSQMLLQQSFESFSECFPEEHIGIIGDGNCDIQFITVATIQTLLNWWKQYDPRYEYLAKNTDHLIVDEAHHLRGDSTWHKVISGFRSRFRQALSATAYLDNESEQSKGIIWLKACIGPMRIDISESRLIKDGYLMTQNVRIVQINGPEKFKNWKWSVSLQREALWCNVERNNKIVKFAKDFSEDGKRVLIVTTRIEHTAVLSECLWNQDVEHETITGRDSSDSRADKVDSFTNGSLRVIVGTVLGEGVDIPEVEVVIVAAGGADPKNTMQRMRNMTISKGKDQAILIDFMDNMNPYLRKHSMERLNVYRSTPEFTIEMVD